MFSSQTKINKIELQINSAIFNTKVQEATNKIL